MSKTIDQDSPAATHQNFRWLERSARAMAHAEFLETAFDVAAGVNTCLEIIYASNLERSANDDADADDMAPPAVGRAEAEKLMRLSIVTLDLLRQEAGNRITASNQFAAQNKTKRARAD